jgi:hypothetical protein
MENIAGGCDDGQAMVLVDSHENEELTELTAEDPYWYKRYDDAISATFGSSYFPWDTEEQREARAAEVRAEAVRDTGQQVLDGIAIINNKYLWLLSGDENLVMNTEQGLWICTDRALSDDYMYIDREERLPDPDHYYPVREREPYPTEVIDGVTFEVEKPAEPPISPWARYITPGRRFSLSYCQNSQGETGWHLSPLWGGRTHGELTDLLASMKDGPLGALYASPADAYRVLAKHLPEETVELPPDIPL